MPPRRRSEKKRGWPDNLYEFEGYYTWRHPITKRNFGLGRIPRHKAFEQAVAANVHVTQQTPTLVERLKGAGETLGAMLDKFDKQLERRELAENTKRTNKSRAKRTREMLGEETAVRTISTQTIAEALEKIAHEEGKQRLAQSMRSYWMELFKFCIAQGVIDRNPVEVTERVKVKIKRARLVLDVFLQLYARTESSCTWLHNAMALALVSLQGRNEIANAAVAQFRDRGWYVERRKTKARLFIPFELRLNVFGMSLEDVYKQCRSTRVLSKYLIHQTEPRGNSPVGSQIWIDTLSRRFSDELAKLGLDWGDKEPPTFHEIRSLGVRLYKQQGGVDVQALAAHADEEMTELYADPRGAEYVRVKIDK